MNEALSPDRILDAAREVLRRFGPGKATVVDVARALGVSHGSVYRHFASKVRLRDAVIERWLEQACAPLAAVAGEAGSARTRLRRWLDLLRAIKRSRASDDPEMFATYCALAAEARDVVAAHVEDLVGQIAGILAEGVKQGEFAPLDPKVAARAVFDATIRFHNPAHAESWTAPDIDTAFEAVWELLLRGLTRSAEAGAKCPRENQR